MTIRCPYCNQPILADVSTVMASRCTECKEIFFLHYLGAEMVTTSFNGNVANTYAARLVNEFSIVEEEEERWSIFHRKNRRAVKLCAHCDESPAEKDGLCLICEIALQLSYEEQEHILLSVGVPS